MADPSAAWEAGHPWSHIYDFVVEREPLARVAGRIGFGTDVSLLYRTIDLVGELPDGSAVLDIPCGGGIALRGLRAGQPVRYVAADISPAMLARTERAARRRGLDQVELRKADVEDLPFADGEFDLCLSMAGLHCFPRPREAVREIARCLRPGRRFAGSVFLVGQGLRYRWAVAGGRLAGVMGPSGTRRDLEDWLAGAGLGGARVEVSGAIAYFDGAKAG